MNGIKFKAFDKKKKKMFKVLYLCQHPTNPKNNICVQGICDNSDIIGGWYHPDDIVLMRDRKTKIEKKNIILIN